MSKAKWIVAVLAIMLAASQAAFAYRMEHDPRSLTLNSVELIGLDSNMCQIGITREMHKSGFLVTDKLDVSDAILKVDVTTRDSIFTPRDQIEDAHYSAVLLGADDRVIFSTGGNENSRDLDELCEDIGDEIVRELDHQRRS